MISAIVVCSSYIAAQMLADIGSLKIVSLFGMPIDAGTFVYPITFTLRDMVHKLAGIKAARAIIVTAAAINIVMALYFWFIASLEGDASVGPQAEFAMVLNPVWRIVVASIVAEVIAELVDTEVYRFWVDRITHRYQWARVLTSNSISVPLDSVVFAWIAFGGILPAVVVWGIVLSNIIVKGATTLISLPLIYLVKEKPVTGEPGKPLMIEQ